MKDSTRLVAGGIASLPASAMLLLQCAVGNDWKFNDFAAYWLAGRLLAQGHDPYDVAAAGQLAEQAGIVSAVGGGYSYPPLFALLIAPLAANLPFTVAASAFAVASLVAFSLTVCHLLRDVSTGSGCTGRRMAVIALVVGAYPPVTTSLVIGQVNLLVLPLLAWGMFAGTTVRPGLRGGAALGLAASIKLVPLAVLIPVVFARQWRIAAGMLLAIAVGLLWPALGAPEAAHGAMRLTDLFEPDPYWTNQSVNGFISRLLLDSDRTHAVFPFVAPAPLLTLVSTGLLALLTAGCLWRARRALEGRRGLELAMAFALVAATAGAPKTSFNNYLPVLLAFWVLLVRNRFGGADLSRLDRSLLAACVLGTAGWVAIEPLREAFDGPPGVMRTLATSSALYGLLALWLVLGRSLLSCARRPDSL